MDGLLRRVTFLCSQAERLHRRNKLCTLFELRQMPGRQLRVPDSAVQEQQGWAAPAAPHPHRAAFDAEAARNDSGYNGVVL